MRKFVFFDTNSPIDDSSEVYRISHGNLAEGDLVTAYMENEEWDAQVVRRGDQWGIKLLSEAREMSGERYDGQQEGFSHGMLVQKQRTLRVLEGLDLPDWVKEEAMRRMMEI